MRGLVPRGFGYDDLLLTPRHSDLESRDQPSLGATLGSLVLSVPIFSSPMDTVTEWAMAMFMADQGGIGVIHRYMDVKRQVACVRLVKDSLPGSIVGVVLVAMVTPLIGPTP